MTIELLYLAPIFFGIAFLYSMAGFGGGSSYLAILALFSFDVNTIKSTALICNIIVVSGGAFLFYKQGYIELKKIWPLIVVSIPMAFLGGRIQLNEKIFFVLLGVTLLLAALAMLLPFAQIESKDNQLNTKKNNGLIGGGIGLLSGMVGIGGGVFLSPLLHLSRWGNAKLIAGSCSLFILVNSLAGLIGQLSNSPLSINITTILALMIAVFIGGQLGNRITLQRLNSAMVKKITGVLIFIVAIRILVQQL